MCVGDGNAAHCYHHTPQSLAGGHAGSFSGRRGSSAPSPPGSADLWTPHLTNVPAQNTRQKGSGGGRGAGGGGSVSYESLFRAVPRGGS